MKGMVNKAKYKDVQEEIQDVSRALRESTNNLIKNLKENPNVSGNLIKVQRDRMELKDLILRCVQELRDQGTYITVKTRVDEENFAQIRLQQLRAREKSLRETVANLEHDLNAEQKLFQRTVHEQKQAIAQLKEELQVLKGSTAFDAKFKRKESIASVSAIWRQYKLVERQFEVKLKSLEDKLQTETLVHSETKDFLIRKQQALADDLAAWESKYDRDIGGLDKQLNDLTTSRTELLEKLSILRERKKVEDDVARAKKEQEDLERELERQKIADLKKRNAAARRIQRDLRIYVQRKKEYEAIKEAGKKKKGGKGKGEGGKKKKK
jgi:IQ domain-containing protein G